VVDYVDQTAVPAHADWFQGSGVSDAVKKRRDHQRCSVLFIVVMFTATQSLVHAVGYMKCFHVAFLNGLKLRLYSTRKHQGLTATLSACVASKPVIATRQTAAKSRTGFSLYRWCTPAVFR